MGRFRPCLPHGMRTMTETEYNRKLDELDRLINDPDVPMQPYRVWDLLAEVSDRAASTERPLAA